MRDCFDDLRAAAALSAMLAGVAASAADARTRHARR